LSVTLRDVASLARVSAKTVSNVVNDHPHVHPVTRARVQQAIAELGYRPNLSARGLRSGRTGVIGLAVPELRQTYFAELADAVIAAAEERGLSVIVGEAGGDREHEIAVLAHGLRQTDGLLFSPERLGTEDRGLLDDVDFPLVMLGERIFGGPTDHVTMHNVRGARAAVEHLLDQGRRRVAVVGAHPDDGPPQLRPSDLRVRGYREALARAGLPHDRRLERVAAPWHPQNGADATRRLIASGVGFDAVFALNDTLGLGVLRALGESGCRIPDDVAVIGFDDIEDGRFSSPTWSTISQDKAGIARTAVALLDERIGGAGSEPARKVTVPFELLVRGSTRPGVSR
jgi:DNA-binding LacI/PurR family transcriptional regulator